MIWALSNWRLIAGGGVLVALGLFYWHYAGLKSDLERERKNSAILESNLQTVIANNGAKDAEIIRLQTEAAETIKIVEIAAIRRVETMETSRQILEDLPDEDPMCGPWGEYFTRVVRQTYGNGD